MRSRGGAAKANVGMSNDKAGEKPARRKTKVSSFYANQNRVSRDLRRTRKGKSMENGSTFPYLLTLKATKACSQCVQTELYVEPGGSPGQYTETSVDVIIWRSDFQEKRVKQPVP